MSNDKLRTLHTILAEKLLEKITDPDAKSADLNVARQFLRDNGIDVHYFKLCERDSNQTYAQFLCSFLKQQEWEKFSLFEIEDKTFEAPLFEALYTSSITY